MNIRQIDNGYIVSMSKDGENREIHCKNEGQVKKAITLLFGGSEEVEEEVKPTPKKGK
jgi:hypothetical protein